MVSDCDVDLRPGVALWPGLTDRNLRSRNAPQPWEWSLQDFWREPFAPPRLPSGAAQFLGKGSLFLQALRPSGSSIRGLPMWKRAVKRNLQPKRLPCCRKFGCDPFIDDGFRPRDPSWRESDRLRERFLSPKSPKSGFGQIGAILDHTGADK